MKTVYSIVVAAVLAAPVSAFAADAVFQHDITPVAHTVPVAKAFDWSGAYVGATVGATVGKKGLPGVKDFKNSSFVGGVHAGYNQQLESNWVLGVEADLNVSKAKKGAVISPKYSAAARVRAGYAIGRILPYVDGGIAVGKLATSASAGTKTEKHTHVGYTVGGGVEYALTDNVTTRVSYHYVDLKDRNYNIGGKTQSVGYNAHNIGVGLSFKF